MWRVDGPLGCGHESSKAVFSKNKITCIIPVQRNLPCGHSRWVPCYIMNPGRSRDTSGKSGKQLAQASLAIGLQTKCMELVDIIHPCQRHMYVGECHESQNPKHCTHRCDLPLPCDHPCSSFCHKVIQDKPGAITIAEIREKAKHCVQGFYCPPCVHVRPEKLPCGHLVEVPCGNKKSFLSAYVCTKVCNKIIVCGHQCIKKCGEPCTPCKLTVKKSRLGVCPHDVYTECFEDAYDAFCPELVIASPPATCGHEILVPCGKGKNRNFLPNRELLKICDAPCATKLSCGHDCSGICSECLQGRFHIRCSNNPCERILPCGHKCQALCSEPCPPCQSGCEYACAHRKCDLKCCVTCEDCLEPCDYNCSHNTCTKLCHEICDREPCYERCTKLIPTCGHNCVGFCGEICPPYCFLCNKDKLAEGNLIGDTPEESDRYIFLPNCGHVVESNSMDGWMKSRGEEEEITPIFCPLCRTSIRQLKRYSYLMFINRKDVLKIISATNGDEEEIKNGRMSLLADMHKTRYTNFQRMRMFLMDFLMDKVHFYKAELSCVDQFWKFITASDKILEEVRLTLPKNRSLHLEKLYTELFQHLEGRKIPWTNGELNDFNREFTRVQHAVEIQKRHGRDKSEVVKNFSKLERTRKKFDTIYYYLLHPVPYTVERENRFLESLKHYDQLLNINLNISDAEKMTILQAFGNQTGRWFKCKKGHVYVITECGGAIERGVCYECGEAIGGTQHRAEEGNLLATEMDGAEEPLYPNSVQVLQF